jgi:PKHD-type hydroxylase
VLLIFRDVLSRELAAHVRLDLENGRPVDPGLITESLRAQPLFLLGVEPRTMSDPVFRRHIGGMEPAAEVADAMPLGRNGIRADVGVVLFLNDAAEYEGGELLIDSGSGEERIKGTAGICAVYPASAPCGFAEIRKGISWTAELWVQSLVPGAAEREILYDVGYALNVLKIFGQDRISDIETLQRCHRNLLRLWTKV